MAGRGFDAFAAAHGIEYNRGARGRGRGSQVRRGRGGYSALETIIRSTSAPPTHGAHDDATAGKAPKPIVSNTKASELNSLVKLNSIMIEEITTSSYLWPKSSPGTFI